MSSKKKSMMGTRYFITVKCPRCGAVEDDVYYAPTCGFVDWNCPKCKYLVSLPEYTGISEEEASNKDIIEKLCRAGREEG